MINIAEKTVLCTGCLQDVEYTIYERMITRKEQVYGENIQYNEWYAICNNCGTEVYVGWIEERNIMEFHAATRINEFLHFLKEKYIEDYDDKMKMFSKAEGYEEKQFYWKGRADEVYDLMTLFGSDYLEFVKSIGE